jgi:capsule polysaccharide export protein KpsE/RkpR
METCQIDDAENAKEKFICASSNDTWIKTVTMLWESRHILAKVTAIAFVLSGLVAVILPNHYESTTRIMPPDQQGGSGALIAALVGRAAPTGIGGLANSLFGVRGTGSLYIDILQSKTIGESLIDHFDLMKIYRTRYRQDALKKLARRTVIKDDRKSGVISISVTDHDRRRARDMAQAYLDELNRFMTRANTSSAHREREFVEQRLNTVQRELEEAQSDLSAFSSKNTAIDVKEQTRAMVDAGARLQAQLIAGQSELSSLEQIYGADNVRVRASRARIALFEHQLEKLSGSNLSLDSDAKPPSDAIYPALRQLPDLSMRWADLYRRVKIQETVFDLLSQEYEMARIQEVKELPVISVIDSPNWPEKKSFPPRALIVLALTTSSLCIMALSLVARSKWIELDQNDPRRTLIERALFSIHKRINTLKPKYRLL